jgi:cytochrome c5
MRKPLAVAVAGAMLAVSGLAQAERSGEEIFNGPCKTCHGVNSVVPNVPKIGDKEAWAPRIAKGMEALFQSVFNGVQGTAMMPRGTCSDCIDGELKAAVEYMVNKSK